MFRKFFKRFAFNDMLISLVLILIGIMMIVKPEVIQSSIAIIIGSVFIFIGIINLIDYFYNKRMDSFLFATAIISIIIGIVIMFCTEFILSAFRIIIAIWIIFSGIMNLHKTIVYRQSISSLWLVSLILSIAIIVAGIIILVNTGSILQMIGVTILVYGVINIVENAIFIRKVDDYLE